MERLVCTGCRARFRLPVSDTSRRLDFPCPQCGRPLVADASVSTGLPLGSATRSSVGPGKAANSRGLSLPLVMLLVIGAIGVIGLLTVVVVVAILVPKMIDPTRPLRTAVAETDEPDGLQDASIPASRDGNGPSTDAPAVSPTENLAANADPGSAARPAASRDVRSNVVSIRPKEEDYPQQPYRFAFVEGTVLPYRVEITIEFEGNKARHFGTVDYTLGSRRSTDDLWRTHREADSQLVAQGSLIQSGSRPGIWALFDIDGGRRTSNVTVSPRGALLMRSVDSPLPHLLGDLYSLPFVMLPDEGQTERVDTGDSTLTIATESGRPSPLRIRSATIDTDLRTIPATYRDVVRIVGSDEHAIDLELESRFEATTPRESFRTEVTGTARLDLKFGLVSKLSLSGVHAVRFGEIDVELPLRLSVDFVTPEMQAAEAAEEERRQAAIRAQSAASVGTRFDFGTVPIVGELRIPRPQEGDRKWDLSPDGRWIALYGNRNLTIVETETGASRFEQSVTGQTFRWGNDSRSWTLVGGREGRVGTIDASGNFGDVRLLEGESRSSRSLEEGVASATLGAALICDGERYVGFGLDDGRRRWEAPVTSRSKTRLMEFDADGRVVIVEEIPGGGAHLVVRHLDPLDGRETSRRTIDDLPWIGFPKWELLRSGSLLLMHPRRPNDPCHFWDLAHPGPRIDRADIRLDTNDRLLVDPELVVARHRAPKLEFCRADGRTVVAGMAIPESFIGIRNWGFRVSAHGETVVLWSELP